MVNELIKQRRLGYILFTQSQEKRKSAIQAYFVMPKRDQEDIAIWQILNSKWIFLSRFRNIPYRNVGPSWIFPLFVNNFIAWFHLRANICFIGKKRSKSNEVKFQKNFVKNWKKTVDKFKTYKDNQFSRFSFRFGMSLHIYDAYPADKKNYEELKIHKFFLKNKLELMNQFLEEGDFKGVALNYKKRKYSHETKSKFTKPKYIKKLLTPILTQDNKFSWKNALRIQAAENGLFGTVFDKEFVKLLQKSKAKKKEILAYVNYVGLEPKQKKKIKNFIHRETGILLS